MDPDVRNAILIGGLVFCLIFASMTLYVAAKTSLRLETFGDLLGLGLYVVSFVIIAMIAAGLIGALRSPPDE